MGIGGLGIAGLEVALGSLARSTLGEVGGLFFDYLSLLIAPCFRSRRAVSDDGLLLSGAYDLTCFIRFFEFYKLWLENA